MLRYVSILGICCAAMACGTGGVQSNGPGNSSNDAASENGFIGTPNATGSTSSTTSGGGSSSTTTGAQATTSGGSSSSTTTAGAQTSGGGSTTSSNSSTTTGGNSGHTTGTTGGQTTMTTGGHTTGSLTMGGGSNTAGNSSTTTGGAGSSTGGPGMTTTGTPTAGGSTGGNTAGSTTGSASDGDAKMTSTVKGFAFNPQSATAVQNGNTIEVTVWENAVDCNTLEAGTAPSGGRVAFSLMGDGNAGYGVGPVGAALGTLAGAGTANVTADDLSAKCKSTLSGGEQAITGTVTPTSVGTTVYSADFNVTLSNGSLKGSFDAAFCQSSAAQATCQPQ